MYEYVAGLNNMTHAPISPNLRTLPGPPTPPQFWELFTACQAAQGPNITSKKNINIERLSPQSERIIATSESILFISIGRFTQSAVASILFHASLRSCQSRNLQLCSLPRWLGKPLLMVISMHQSLIQGSFVREVTACFPDHSPCNVQDLSPTWTSSIRKSLTQER